VAKVGVDNPCWTRRRTLRTLAVAGAYAALAPSLARAELRAILTRPIPSTGELLPAVGLGTWITFNVGDDPVARDACTDVIRNFVEAGGKMIDSSPMYGSSQDVVGYGLRKAALTGRIFAADKVWISSGAQGREQIERSRRKWQVSRFDLLQVHNLLNWQEHLPTLFALKAAGQLRYVGITTSEGRRHRDIEQLMRSQPVDFVQATYNPVDREVEERILPLARDRGIAVIVNRPFREGALVRALARQPLPSFAADIDCASWAQLVLKFIVSHPAVTCVIPATTSVAHVRENMNAAYGRLPDTPLRQRIVAAVERA
jgi:diketogulonate reductase-like aldo/keto reductase